MKKFLKGISDEAVGDLVRARSLLTFFSNDFGLVDIQKTGPRAGCGHRPERQRIYAYGADRRPKGHGPHDGRALPAWRSRERARPSPTVSPICTARRAGFPNSSSATLSYSAKRWSPKTRLTALTIFCATNTCRTPACWRPAKAAPKICSPRPSAIDDTSALAP